MIYTDPPARRNLWEKFYTQAFDPDSRRQNRCREKRHPGRQEYHSHEHDRDRWAHHHLHPRHEQQACLRGANDSATFGDTVIDTTGLRLAKGAVKLDGEALNFFDPASTGTSSSPLTTLDKNGLVIFGGPSITTSGIDAGGKKITRVGTGELQENGDNAATTGQLFTVNRNVNSVTSDIESLRTELTDVKTSVEAKADKTDTGAWTLAGTGKDSSPATAQIGANSKVSFTGDDNLEVVTGTDGEDSTVAFALNADVNLDSATFGDTVIDTTGLRLAKGAVKLDDEALNFFDPASTGTSSSPLTTLDKNGLVIFGGPSVTTSGIDAGGKKITRVGTGELQENGDNAATTGQLFTVSERLKTLENSGSKDKTGKGGIGGKHNIISPQPRTRQLIYDSGR